MGNSWNVHVNSIIYSKIMINLLQKSYISVLFAKHVVIGKSDVNSLCTCAHDAISYSNFKRNDVVPPRMNFPAKLVWNEFGWVFFFFKIKKKNGLFFFWNWYFEDFEWDQWKSKTIKIIKLCLWLHFMAHKCSFLTLFRQ